MSETSIAAAVGGQEVHLPKYDMALARKAEAIDSADGREATWRAEWDFLRAASDSIDGSDSTIASSAEPTSTERTISHLPIYAP